MNALFIGAPERVRAAEIISYARAHVYRPAPSVRPPGLDPRYVAHFHLGFRCVFSFTEMRDGRLYRHLSISEKGSRTGFPHPAAAEELGKLFGFEGPLESWSGGPVAEERCVVLVQLMPPGTIGSTSSQSSPLATESR